MKKRKLKVKFKKLFIFSFFLLLIPFVSKLFSDILANPVNYIYLDLNCSDIVFDSDNYSGCVYKTVDGITSSVEVSGKHSETNYYYIYQYHNYPIFL